METSSQRSYQPAESHSSGLMLVFSAAFWRGVNTQNRPWTSLFITAAHKRDESHKIRQKTTVFWSRITHCTWYFLYTRIVNFETHNEFHNVCVLHEKLRARLFVLLRMSCLTGQSRHETRKRDVASVHCWAVLQPMRNRFLLTQLSVWPMLAGIMLLKALETPRAFTANTGVRDNLFEIYIFFTKYNRQARLRPLHSDVPSGSGIWIDFLC